MSVSADLLIERMQMKSRLSRWRFLAAMLALLLFMLFSYYNSDLTLLPGKNYIARIKIENMILQDDYRDQAIRDLAEDPALKGVILHIDSPGGTSVGGEDLYLVLSDLAAKKPLTVVMDGMATSAAYMAAVTGEYVVAHRASITGSIGVIFEMPNIQGLADKIGVTMTTISTGPLKGEPSPLKPLSEEARTILQSVVDDFYRYFIEIVAKGRKLSIETVTALADGRIYSATQALDKQLIDAIGTEKNALAWLQEKKSISAEVPVVDVDLTEPDGTWQQLLNSAAKSFPQLLQFNHSGLLSIS